MPEMTLSNQGSSPFNTAPRAGALTGKVMSQYSIQQSLGNASGVAVSPINADATLSTGVVIK